MSDPKRKYGLGVAVPTPSPLQAKRLALIEEAVKELYLALMQVEPFSNPESDLSTALLQYQIAKGWPA